MSKKEERESLLREVYDLEEQLCYAEYKIPSVLKKIQDLKPTKAELEEGLQDLFDMYL